MHLNVACGHTDLLWCIQSNKGSCLWEWTIAVSRFSLVPLKHKNTVMTMSERQKRFPLGVKVEGILLYNLYILIVNYLATVFYNFLTTTTLSVHTSWENKQRQQRVEIAGKKQRQKGPEDLEEDRGQTEKERDRWGGGREREGDYISDTEITGPAMQKKTIRFLDCCDARKWVSCSPSCYGNVQLPQHCELII